MTSRRGVGAFKRKENAENDENGNETKDEKAKGGKKYRLRETDKRLSRARKITNGELLLLFCCCFYYKQDLSLQNVCIIGSFVGSVTV